MSNAMDLEQAQNPLAVASMSVRCFSIFHAYLIHGYLLILFGAVELVYNYVVGRKYSLLVDATTVWREVKRLRQDRAIRVGFQGLLLVVSVLNMLYLFMVDVI